MKKLVLLCSAASIIMPAAAMAQSTGSQETEKETIVVTGTRLNNGVNGIVVPDATKAKAVITQEFIARQAPGQTILNTLNLVPSVNFTQNDAYGSSGGNIRIRGFDGNRISLTFDGVPLNDSGNYAIFANQQLDPELIEQVNVNLGVTDVDSPTASAAGGTVNYRTMLPSKDMRGRIVASLGQFDYQRLFAQFQTGDLNSSGTRAFIAASRAHNSKFKGPGDINKWQLNGRIYQPLGNNGDFLSLAAHYNHNRNNNYRSPTLTELRTEFGSTIIPATGSPDMPALVGDYSTAQWNRIYNNIEMLSSCRRPTPGAGVQDEGSTTSLPASGNQPALPGGYAACTNYYGHQINPSNTFNVRGQSRFTLAPGLLLTVDPTYQYTLADGGSQTLVYSENSAQLKGSATTSPGVDLNGDGDYVDKIRLFNPSITNTRRFTLLSSLIYDLDRNNRVRIAYTFDRARHRQTGETEQLDAFLNNQNPFGGRNGTPVLDAAGNVLQNRDRTSIALLNQLSGQYIGNFFDRRVRLEIGVRSPWFKRNIDQHCYTPTSGSGFPYCSSQPITSLVIVPGTQVAPFPSSSYYAPFAKTYKYHKLLPSIGATFKVTPDVSVFGSYAKGFSAPRTDNLYRTPIVTVQPETTDAFDAGIRYTTRIVQAQATAWKINYSNRIVTSYDPDTRISFDRNVGSVRSWGVDGSIAVKPIKPLTLLALASYTSAKLQSNLLLGTTGTPGVGQTVPAGTQFFAPTAGKMVVETPKWQYGGRAQVEVGPLSIGFQGKHVGKRFATDVNDVVVKGYTLFDLDARLGMDQFGIRGTYLQFNALNLFNAHYFGNLGTQINAFQVCPTGANCSGNTNAPRFTPGAPRTLMASLSINL